jgi:hypothetical protein
VMVPGASRGAASARSHPCAASHAATSVLVVAGPFVVITSLAPLAGGGSAAMLSNETFWLHNSTA